MILKVAAGIRWLSVSNETPGKLILFRFKHVRKAKYFMLINLVIILMNQGWTQPVFLSTTRLCGFGMHNIRQSHA